MQNKAHAGTLGAEVSAKAEAVFQQVDADAVRK